MVRGRGLEVRERYIGIDPQFVPSHDHPQSGWLEEGP